MFGDAIRTRGEAGSPRRIVIVDDDPGLLRLMERRLQAEGHETECFQRGTSALEWFESEQVDLAIVDLKLPDISGDELLEVLAAKGLDVPFLVATGFGDERIAVDMMKRGARDYLMKDGAFLDLLPQVVDHVLAQVEKERRLDLAKERLDLLGTALGQASDAVLVTTASLDQPGPQIVFVNPAFVEMTGWSEEELIGKSPRLLQGPRTDRAELDRMRRELAEGRSYFGFVTNYRKDGSHYEVELRIAPVRDDAGRVKHWIAIERDVTQRRRLEEQMRQSSKMEAIGALAGGIAHDFNNMLAVIRGRVELALARLDEGDALHEELAAVREASIHSTDLTRQLLAFSRGQANQPRALDLNGVVARSEKLLRATLGKAIELVTHYEDELALVWADPGHVEQVIMNLAVNAKDAMEDKGRLEVSLQNVEVRDSTEAPVAGMPEGLYASLVVKDEGCGIDPEVQSRIFEPFFSTKDPGRATGLGLATVYGIVKQARGYIGVTSEPGVGTSFAVCIPAHEAARADEEPSKRAEQRATGGHETVLVAEDETMVRELIIQCLGDAGYQVLAAADGKDALEVFEAQGDGVALLLSDVMMPRMGGARLAEALTLRRSSLPVLFMSGNAGEIVDESRVPAAQTFYLPKPFTPSALLRAVRAVLDGEATPGQQDS